MKRVERTWVQGGTAYRALSDGRVEQARIKWPSREPSLWPKSKRTIRVMKALLIAALLLTAAPAAHATLGACCFPDPLLPDPPHNGYDCQRGVLEEVCYEEFGGVAWELDMSCPEMVAKGICPPTPVPTASWWWLAIIALVTLSGAAWWLDRRRA